MANTDIKWFSFDNTNAPQLTNTWGCLIDVLDACLVTGFGSQLVSNITILDGVGTATFGSNHNFKQFQVIEFSGSTIPELNKEFKILGITSNKIEFVVNLPDQTVTGTISAKLASLGWTKAFTGTQKAVYQAKDKIANPYFLRVDNSRDPVYTTTYAKFAKVGVLESCSGIDDIGGNQFPFDKSNPTKNWVGTGSGSSAIAGWFKWQYAVHESAAASSGWYESEGTTDGLRRWFIIGSKDSLYIINSATANSILEIPYSFGVIQHNGLPKPYLIATNRYAIANTSVLCATPLGDPDRIEVASLYNYAGVKINTLFSKLITGFGSVKSGVATNLIKQDPIDGLILSPFYLLDPDNFILDKLPLVNCCMNDATTIANYTIFTEPNRAYIGCRFRTAAGGVLGLLLFTIYDEAG
ncbi:hypothetical protein [Acinetobacter bereziniae]|uniref:hypothetical protein n=1 Tax=Acinetobacter bereziniae TaxID=106648 RepID=UPI001119F0CF|nr:hypothetical protein [Acinetobacter bereziniae]TNL42294.1 hypothetical protein EYB59_22685 [Acinetobacter bereziniae]